MKNGWLDGLDNGQKTKKRNTGGCDCSKARGFNDYMMMNELQLPSLVRDAWIDDHI